MAAERMPGVDEVVERIAERYRDATRYEDRGTALLLKQTASQLSFETHFKRPGTLSFAVDVHSVRGDEHVQRKYALSYDGTTLKLDLGSFVPPGLAIDTLDLGLAALTGVSLGVAHFVPQLLMPDVVTGRPLFGTGTERTLSSDAFIDDEPHHVIDIGDGEPVQRVYASKSTQLIRRIEMLSMEDAAQRHHPAAARFVLRIDYKATVR